MLSLKPIPGGSPHIGFVLEEGAAGGMPPESPYALGASPLYTPFHHPRVTSPGFDEAVVTLQSVSRCVVIWAYLCC
jgi:hypothetical protein